MSSVLSRSQLTPELWNKSPFIVGSLERLYYPWCTFRNFEALALS